ncbi:MAG: 30S ribosomal protein S8 [Candidatus Doudnabacteria bacterium]|nr:30S ribosomal protein S8 [Candidatus Doudnabacteria bacterium]
MPSTDPIADMFTSLRNAAAVGKRDIAVPASRLKRDIADVLKAEGFLHEVESRGEGVRAELLLSLKYDQQGAPVLRHIQRISSPGQRLSSSYKDLRRVRQGLGLALLTTSKGILTDTQARKQKIGGEIIAHVW